MSDREPIYRSAQKEQIATIDQLAIRVGSGVTPTGGSEVYVDSGVIFIRSQNVTNSGLFLGDVAFIDDKTHQRMSSSALHPFDVLLNITGASIGRCCFVPADLGPANVNQHVCAIRLAEPNLGDACFLSATLASHIGQTQIWRLNAGGNREGLNYRQLRSFRVPWPDEQKRSKIAKILSTLDKAIEQPETLIAKLQQIKAGLMQDLFTRGVMSDGHLRPTRVQAPHLYKESPLGWIPKEWEVKKLGEILKDCGGYLQTGPFGSQLHAHEYQMDGIPVVMPQDINDGSISTDQIARIGIRKVQELSRHRIKVGDVVIARRGDLSRAAAISDVGQGWVCGTGCFLLRLSGSALRSEFAASVYRHTGVQRQIAGLAVGTTMPSLNNHVMERLLFFFCDVNEQDRILAALHAVDQDVMVMRLQVEKLTMEKLGLMNDLLTGRVRVKVTESEEASE